MYTQLLKYCPFLQKLLQGITFSPFNDITSLSKFKNPKPLLEEEKEKYEKLLLDLIQIAPEKVTEESYKEAIKKLRGYLITETPPKD